MEIFLYYKIAAGLAALVLTIVMIKAIEIAEDLYSKRAAVHCDIADDCVLPNLR